MKFIKTTIITLLTMLSATFAQESKMANIDVFFKNQKPSQLALAEINKVLENYKTTCKISYYLITDSVNAEIIAKYGLPSTHFPVAVVIDGKFTAKINDKTVSFIHFPNFMAGIGRHEGNWSIADMEAALKDNSLLAEKNILPELEAEKADSKDKCDH